MSGLGVIGQRLTWKHVDVVTDKPSIDCTGVVEATAINSMGQFLVLIHKDDGSYAQQQVLDMKSAPPIFDYKVSNGELRREFRPTEEAFAPESTVQFAVPLPDSESERLGVKIIELDLADQVEGLGNVDAVCKLLDLLMAELREAGETIAKLTEAKAPKKAKEPKGSECACGVKFRTAEDFRDHLPCEMYEAARSKK